MFGTNRDTNVAGWLAIALQIIKLVLPLVTKQPLDEATAHAFDTASALATGAGVVRAKDKRVTGAGATGPDAARRAE